MNWLTSIGIAFLTALIGAFGTALVGLLCVDWFRVSSREGGSDTMVVFVGLMGGVLGFIIGLVAARMVAAGVAPTFLKGLGMAAGLTIGLLAVATMVCWLAADLDTTLHGNAVQLQAEIRCPVGFEIPSGANAEEWYAHIDAGSRRATSYSPLPLGDARKESDHWIIPVTLDLHTSVREKFLYVRLAKVTQVFVPLFPSKPPARFFDWSSWRDGAWEGDKPQPPAEARFALRFRLQEVFPEKAGPVAAPELTADEIQENKKAEDLAALAALTVDSPLEECMQLTLSSHEPEVQARAGAIIGRRPQVVAEISMQILSDDPAVADRALRALAFIKPLPIGLSGPVGVVGDRVIARLQHLVVAKREDDPTNQEAAAVSVLFFSWFLGLHALHDFAGVDGLPELNHVLTLARQREDSYVIKNDVVRIAVYYLNEWGAKPVPAT